jgi:outer membrane cobalamin receptor
VPLTVGVGWDYTGKRFTTAANTEYLEPFALYSARLGYAVTEKDTLSLRGENLTNNTEYVLQPYYPMPGLTLTASWAHVF